MQRASRHKDKGSDGTADDLAPFSSRLSHSRQCALITQLALVFSKLYKTGSDTHRLPPVQARVSIRASDEQTSLDFLQVRDPTRSQCRLPDWLNLSQAPRLSFLGCYLSVLGNAGLRRLHVLRGAAAGCLVPRPLHCIRSPRPHAPHPARHPAPQLPATRHRHFTMETVSGQHAWAFVL